MLWFLFYLFEVLFGGDFLPSGVTRYFHSVAINCIAVKAFWGGFFVSFCFSKYTS